MTEQVRGSGKRSILELIDTSVEWVSDLHSAAEKLLMLMGVRKKRVESEVCWR